MTSLAQAFFKELSWEELSKLAPKEDDQIEGPTNPYALIRLFGSSEKSKINEILKEIQRDISNIESDIYRINEKGIECLGSVRCGGGFVDDVIGKVNCK